MYIYIYICLFALDFKTIKMFTLQIYEIEIRLQGTAVLSQFSETHQPCFSYFRNTFLEMKSFVVCAH